ncbi:MAG: asparaginase [Oscillospiraceae bacterium]|nr:asparaginase [Oscillospiraceae bacterium]
METVQLMNLDSANVSPSHWLSIARTIEMRYWDYDGFVIIPRPTQRWLYPI